ncbi:hypothetical protein U1Q18_022635, partial [Sarracenia purpurea var. burkii]
APTLLCSTAKREARSGTKERENRGTSSPESGPARFPPEVPLPRAERRMAVREGGDKRRWWSDGTTVDVRRRAMKTAWFSYGWSLVPATMADRG